MSTFQLDDNDAPVHTHVNMGDIIPPRTASESNNTASHDTAADTDRQTNGTNGPTDGSKPADAQPENVRLDNAQTHSTQHGS
ncbi:hypothetical protein Purlil1_46 [Purpureocillium lilacinum]|uniref:Uncharacterized protein n=1 Tax=Purpureocillium lilacinum TaxID=33203 RepID=A0ABR0CG95_PURLI|nr:hypothetical protein Purlil1_46 [Purpureocillium lilacinum]